MSSAEFEQFKRLLKKDGYFVTKPRMRLFGLLQSHPALSLKELIKLTKKHDQVTVYRNVDLFEKLGVVTRLRLGWNTKIELSDMFRHHHHHMSCLKCGRVYILKDSPAIEHEIARISSGSGFKATDHQLEISGLCKNCQKL
jgi:Fur family ferric uptake transcriptional regulator